MQFSGLFPLAVWLFANDGGSSNSQIERWQNSMADSRVMSVEASEKAKSGQQKEAVQLFEDAMIFGRKAALALYESNDDQEALDWLVMLYRDSAKTRLELGDIENARKDAWGACVFSQNNDIPSLECLANVCEAGEDDIGQLQALKRIMEIDVDCNSDSNNKTIERVEDIQSTIASLEEKIKKRLA